MAADEDKLLLRKVHGLGDLDLAALLGLIGREHCIIGTATPALDDLVAELRLVASRTFGLESAVVDCTPRTTLDDLASALLVTQQQPPPLSSQSHSPRSASGSPLAPRITTTTDSYFPRHHQHTRHRSAGGSGGAGPGPGPAKSPSASTHPDGQAAHHPQLLPSPLRARTPPGLGYGYGYGYGRSSGGYGGSGGGVRTPVTPHIANVIIAKNLDAAPKAVQIQCLELLRTRRLFTRTSVQAAPKQFLFVAVLATTTDERRGSGGDGGKGGGSNNIAARLTPHLNDFFYISHWHDPEDGFAHLEEEEEDEDEDEDEEREREREPQRTFRRSGGDYFTADDGNKYRYGDGDDNDNDSLRADTASFESAESVIRRSVAGTPRVNFNNNSTPKEHNTRTPRGGRSRRSTVTDDRGYRRDGNNEDSYYYGFNTNTNDNYNQDYHQPQPPLLSDHDVATLALAAREVAVDIDVLRYEMNVVSFLRLHRAVAATGGGGGVGSGVTPASTKHLEQLVRSLAALHGLTYATPPLVGLAARKAYLHRLRVVDAARERSVQWGSDRGAVAALLEGVGAEEVIEDALGSVAAPL